jgi:hypothetical protein
MRKLCFAILLPTLFIGCTSSSYPIHNIPPKNTVVKEEPATKKEFRKDHHRYDSRYRNFDYNRLGYSSSNGLYYGYFDDMGYFYNNIYFMYDDKYTYDDRHYRKGYFRPDAEHVRVYIHHFGNNWNQLHHYREPNQYVGHFLYYETNPHPKFRVYHRQEYGPSYQNSK